MAQAYDLSHLDDVRFGADRPQTEVAPPDHLFFGFVGAMLFPGGALLLPAAFAAQNFRRLGSPLGAALSFGAALALSIAAYLVPLPWARCVAIILLCLVIITVQARLLRRGILARTHIPRPSPRLRRLMVGFFILAIFSHRYAWELLLEAHHDHQLARITAARSPAERAAAAAEIPRFAEDAGFLFGRSAAAFFREQARALQAADPSALTRALAERPAFERALNQAIDEAIAAAEAAGEPFRGLKAPFSIADWLASRASKKEPAKPEAEER